ncbi:MAG: FtsX-like permease family protein [Nannocystis sp.]|uniref:ABC transporter permease n=1 Tax=Nannocystis sp. TaxID=1962667 RepID=UPI00242894ED|nr:FtsX-like permease family protein [Nannocystis sp.]MBK9754987.1 FtsX-like permease family protein [Nannocystis sp.]
MSSPAPSRLHWHIAWRHLRVGERPPAWVRSVLAVSFYLVIVGLGLVLFAQYGLAPEPIVDTGALALPAGIEPLDLIPTPRQSYYGAFGGLTLLLGAMLLLGGVLSRIFTVLATVITISVMLGCMALVVVLSLMTGLENDLRDKILGQRAHIRISREDLKPFADYRPLAEAVAAEPGMLGASPYLQGEVMVRSGFQRQGGILLGILPDLHASVSNLPEILQEGEYRFLAEPAAVPESQFNFEMLPPVREPDEVDEPAADPGDPGDKPAGKPATQFEKQPFAGTGATSLPPSPLPIVVADPDDGGGWEDPELEINALRAAGKLPPARATNEKATPVSPAAALPPFPREVVLDDEEGWEDPEAEIAKLRKQGKLPPASATPQVEPEPEPEPEPVESPDAAVDAAGTAPLDGVFIGSEKAKELAAHLGDPVQLITPIGRLTPAGRIPGVMKVKVAGVFDAHHYEYDRWLVYAELKLAQAFLRAGDRVSGIEIKVDDVHRLADRKAQVQAIVTRLGRDDLVVQDWQELNRSLFSAMALEKIAVFIALLCVILVASFGILGSNLMSVLEKAKEIAILKTMGCTDRLIQRVFIAEGLCLGVLGGALGIVAGIGLCLVLDRFGLPLGGTLQGFEELPVAIDPLEVALVGLSSLAIVWLSSLYPARVASRMRPVDALRQAER